MLAVVTRPSASEKSLGSWMLRAPRLVVSEPGLAGVVDPEGDSANAVPVLVDVAGDLAVGTEGGGEDEASLALLEDSLAGAVALTGLGAGAGDERHAEGGAVEIGTAWRALPT